MHSVSLAMHESTRLQEKVEDQVALACSLLYCTVELHPCACGNVAIVLPYNAQRILYTVYCSVELHPCACGNYCTVHCACRNYCPPVTRNRAAAVPQSTIDMSHTHPPKTSPKRQVFFWDKIQNTKKGLWRVKYFSLFQTFGGRSSAVTTQMRVP